MDKKPCEGGAQNASNFECRAILHGVDKPIACQTPEKASEPLPTKSKEGKTQLPETYRTIADLFDHMICSLRLLSLRKKSPTFQNISTQVQIMSKRKFSYVHLAQIKYILPEALHIDKVVVHDKKTLCMKPDLKITLIFEDVGGHSTESAYMALRHLFGSKLNELFGMHPKGTDIPEFVLPEPFNQRTLNLVCEDSHVDSITLILPTSNEIQLLPEKFHPYPSFGRHFSRETVVPMTEKVQCFPSTQTSLSSHACDCLDNQEGESRSWQGCTTLCLKSNDMTTTKNMEGGQEKKSRSMCFQPSAINTPTHVICPPHSVSSPDIKAASLMDSLMTETPMQSIPRRLIPTSDVKLQIMTTEKSTSSYMPAKRVLDFSHLEGNDALGITVERLESCRAAQDSITESIRGCSKASDASGAVVLVQEVEKSQDLYCENSNQAQAGLTWQQMPSSLLDLVNVVHSIFNSVKCSPITKEELLHKIIMNSLDVSEIRDAEERIEFLEKVVPDWICKKFAATGDIMYCIKKVSDLDSVRSRLISSVNMGDDYNGLACNE